MSNYIKKSLYYLLLFVLIFLIYYVRVSDTIVSIDTETFINSPNDIIYSWYSIGRFSLGIYINLFNLIPLNIYFNNIISLFLYVIATLLLVNSFNKGKFSYKKHLLTCLIILTSPLLAEQYAFTLQNVEVALSYLLLVIIMMGIVKIIYKNKYIYLIITPLLILVFGTYQSFYLMYITLSIIYFIDNYDDNLKIKSQLKIISIYVIILGLYSILTIVTGNIINTILNVEATSYLTDQMNWFNGNFIKGILYCGYYVVSTLLGIGIDNNLGFSYLLIILFFYLKKDRKKKSILYKLALIALMISPFLISILFGSITFSRTQFSIPIIMAYLYGKFFNKKSCYVICCCIVFVQAISVMYLFNIDKERYNNDIKLSKYIEKLDNENDLPIIFINKVKYERKITGEVLGKSFYNWDYKSERLSNDRIAGFVKTKGIEYKVPTLEQIKEVVQNKQTYSDFINYEDKYIVINLEKYN